MKRKWMALLLSCLLSAGLCTEAYAEKSAKPLAFATVTLDGEEVSSRELFQDHVITVVNVWASWCEPCIEELEELEELNAKLQRLDCGVVGILWDGDTAQEEGLAIVAEKKLSYPTVLPCEEMGELTEITVFPTTFFIDSEGRQAAEAITGAKTEQYEQTVRTLLNKKTAAAGYAAAAQPVGNGDGADNRTEKPDNQQSGTSIPEGMKLVCDGDSCWLVPVDVSGEADSGPDIPAAPATVEPVPSEEGETHPEPAEQYPSCPIIVVCLSEDEVVAWAAGEYAGLDGRTYISEGLEGDIG